MKLLRYAGTLQRVSVAGRLRGWMRFLLLVTACLMCHQAQAQSCSASMTAITFPSYSPIASTAVTSTGTATVTCTWGTLTAANALVCLNLTATTPRSLVNGTHKLNYELYTDAARTTQWGATTLGTTPLSVVLSKPLFANTLSTSITFYGRVFGNQQTIPTVGNADTLYSVLYSAETSAVSGFYVPVLQAQPTCASLTTSAGSFPFTATATVINNCTIAAAGLTFQTGTSGLLNQALTTQGSLTIQCTDNDAYKITLSPGASTVQTARTMVGATGGGTVKYQLYTDAGLSLVWGDGTGGTSTSTGTGTGNSQTIVVYGRVPAQSPTPAPSTYTDTITATIYF